MSDSLSVILDIFSYLIGAWIAFKIFDYRKRGQKQEARDDLLLWPLLLLFFAGIGTLLSYLFKSWFGIQ